jgi:hypothetical protein
MRDRRTPAALVLVINLVLTPVASAETHDHGGHAPRALGEVHFGTSCSPSAHKFFNQGMPYQHSFWYSASTEAFEQTLKLDPGCAIAYWGIAQSLLLNPFGPPPPTNLAAGLAAIQKGKAIDFARVHRCFGRVLRRSRKDWQRLLAYLEAMEQVATRHPDDDEAQISYALALNLAASPADKTHALPLKAHCKTCQTVRARSP